MPLGLADNPGYQPSLLWGKAKEMGHWMKGPRANLQEEYQLSQHSRDLTKLCCPGRLPEAARREPTEIKMEDSMLGTEWSLLKASLLLDSPCNEYREKVEEGTLGGSD